MSMTLCILGTVGYTIEDRIDKAPTPNVPNKVFFADEAIPSNPLKLIITANAEVTWDRSDVFLVIADQGKKSQCDGLNHVELRNQNSQLCTKDDDGYIAIGSDNSSGISWDVRSEEDYVGIGTFTQLAEGFELSVEYSVEMSLSPVGYFVGLMTILAGYSLVRYG